MEIKNAGWSVRQLLSMSTKGTIRFDYPIQRSGGQWKKLQQSYLIHSLAGSYPIPPIYLLGEKVKMPVLRKGEEVEEDVTIRWVLDGKQRITTIEDYTKDEYKLDMATPEVKIDGETYEIADKLFSELDSEVQEMILSRTIVTYTMNAEEVSDDEIEDLFYRMNNGSALTVQQKSKALMGVEWATLITDLGNHVLVQQLAAFSKTQLKSDAHLTALQQTMMMLDDYNYKNVSQKVISDYSVTFKDDKEKKMALYKDVEKAMNYLTDVYDKKESFLLKKVNFPMTLITALEALNANIDPDVFYQWSVAFKEAVKSEDSVTDVPTNYNDYAKVGTTDRNKADGRMNEMKRHFKEYIAIYHNQPAQ